MSIETLFEGQELSEEFKTKVSTVFEAAVIEATAAVEKELTEKAALELQEAVAAVTTQLEEVTAQAAAREAELVEQAEAYGQTLAEEFDLKLTEASEKYEASVTEYVQETVLAKVDKFLDYVAEQYVEENRLAIQSGLKTEMVESFLQGMHQLFKEHYVEVPEDKVDVVEEMNTRIEELEGRLNSTIEENVEMKNFIREKSKAEIVEEMCEGLADTQVERFNTIAEGIEFRDVDQFRSKLEVVRDTLVVEGVRPAKPVEAAKPATAPLNESSANDMGSLIADLTRLASKK